MAAARPHHGGRAGRPAARGPRARLAGLARDHRHRDGRARPGLRPRRAAVALPHLPLGGHRPRRLHAARLARARVADRADLARADRRHPARPAAAAARAGRRHRDDRVRPRRRRASAGSPPTTPPSSPASSPRPPRPRRATRREPPCDGRRRRSADADPAHRRRRRRRRGGASTRACSWSGRSKDLVQLLPAFAVVLLTGRAGRPHQVWISRRRRGASSCSGVLRWRTTRYRITDERVELHTGWLRRQRRSVPRDRIRTVDLTRPAAPGLRAERRAGRVGDRRHRRARRGLDLDAVSNAEAERLRRELLDRSARRGPPPRPRRARRRARPPATGRGCGSPR